MCEFLLRTVDAYSRPTGLGDDFDSRIDQAGDVVAVCADGWNWGRRELSVDNFYRIIKAPNLALADAALLTAPEPAATTNPPAPGSSPGGSSKGGVALPRLRKRLYTFPLSSPLYPASLAAYLADLTRVQQFYTWPELTGPATTTVIAGAVLLSALLVKKNAYAAPTTPTVGVMKAIAAAA